LKERGKGTSKNGKENETKTQGTGKTERDKPTPKMNSKKAKRAVKKGGKKKGFNPMKETRGKNQKKNPGSQRTNKKRLVENGCKRSKTTPYTRKDTFGKAGGTKGRQESLSNRPSDIIIKLEQKIMSIACIQRTVKKGKGEFLERRNPRQSPLRRKSEIQLAVSDPIFKEKRKAASK